jgi:hypothetical protein
MKKLALATLYVVSILVAFVAGGKLSYKHSLEGFSVVLAETQAMLWFNHLLQFREIEADLKRKGCEEVALEKTKIAIDGEMRLLSSFHQEYPDSSINKYISDRDVKLLGELKGFKSKYGDSWTVPQCGAVRQCAN